MTALRINTHQASPLHADHLHSPVFSPVSASPHDSLSARCLRLAHKFGHDAVHDDPLFSPTEEQGNFPVPHSPAGSRRNSIPSLSPGRTASSPVISPLSPRSSFGSFPPTPEGSFLLSEIREEDADGDATPHAEMTSLQFRGGEKKRDGSYGSPAAADDELSFSSFGRSIGGRRTSSFSSVARDLAAEQVDTEEIVGPFFPSLRLRWAKSESKTLTEAETEQQVAAIRQTLAEGTTWLTVDLWLVNGELLVGASQESLDPSKTFSSAFIEPLLRVFSTSVVPVGTAHRRRSSVFAHISLQHPLQLVIRLHSPASISFPYLVDSLEPLHEALLLTTYCPNAGITTPALITVVSSDGHGAELVPVEDLAAVAGPRFIYRDASVVDMAAKDASVHFSNELTPVAAGDLKEATGWDGRTALTEVERDRIRQQVEAAHKRHVKVRYEGLPNFPNHTRESVRSTLLALGVDYL
ncbi:hypothetical protein JCM11641_001571 [Rhodosporidiobolus odoratus]